MCQDAKELKLEQCHLQQEKQNQKTQLKNNEHPLFQELQKAKQPVLLTI